MADNYLSFATSFEFPETAANDFINIVNGLNGRDVTIIPEWYRNKYAIQDEESLEKHLNTCDNREMSLNDAQYDDGCLYLAEESYANIDGVADILSDVMEQHSINDVITFEGAYTCSKLRPGEFGGVAVAVGPGIVRILGTYAMCDKLAEEVREEMNTENGPSPA